METDLRVRAAAPKSVRVGKKLTYAFTVTNGGPGQATGVALVNRLPGNAAFVGANASQGACTGSGGKVRCALGDLETGATARVKLTVRAPARPGRLTSVTSVSASEADPAPGNNRVTVRTTVRE